MSKPVKAAGPAPGPDRLREAALHHLSRFGTTQTGLLRVLDRRIQRWAVLAKTEGMETGPAVEAARGAARQVVSELGAAGAVDDAAFAAARARRLARSGRSRRATAAHLAGKGVTPELVEGALGPPDTELPAALAFVRRRRIGPFRTTPDPGARLQDLAALARAGFPRGIAERALAMDPDAASDLVLAFSRDAHAG